MFNSWLTETFSIKYPIILAPMFLISNEKMLIEAAKSGFMGCIPSLNYKTPEELRAGMKRLKENCPGPYGINLIANKSNIHLDKHLSILEEFPPAFVITSLGSPEEIIKRLKPKNVKVFCDVVDIDYAKKVEKLGADALIAVNSGAGGHAGNIPASILVPMLLENSSLPVISAGGIGTGRGLLSMLALGACGVSMGSIFIAADESPASNDYKKGIVEYGAKDIVMSDKISGTPCSVIQTPYVKKIGTKQNALESFLNKNKQFKKYAKMLTYYKGMKAVENAAFAATYKTVWIAGPSIEFCKKNESINQTIQRIAAEFETAVKELKEKC